MSDQVTSDGQFETSPASNGSEEPPSRVLATLGCLPMVAGAAIGLALAYGSLHGWDWALAGLCVLAVSWLLSYLLVPTPWLKRRGERLEPVATKAGTGATLVWALAFAASWYLAALVMPFDAGVQSWAVGSALVVHVLIIFVLVVVTFHLLFPLIAPKQQRMLVWRVARGKPIAKLQVVLFFGLIVSGSISLWNQLLLRLAKHDVVWFYLTQPKAGAAPPERVSLTDLINGNHILRLLMWQLGDMVPSLNVNDTLGFEQPLFYSSFVASWLVLAFKVIVGLALIGTVVAIIQAIREEPKKPFHEVSLLPHTTQRVLTWLPKAWRRRRDIQAPETADP